MPVLSKFIMNDLLMSGLLWRLRGIIGWPGTVAFALVQALTLWPLLGEWSVLFSLWVVLGEMIGWKPKKIWDSGDWWKSSLYGFLIGGIGAIAVPLSTWLHRKFGEPPFPNNTKAFSLPFWSSPKFLLDWRGAWNEVYFGLIFSATLQGVIWL